MKAKKREREEQSRQSEEVARVDLEIFLQTFKKPTQIYRYLRTRNLVSPFMLQRNLWYMKHRQTVGNAKRKAFKVDSILESLEPKHKGETTPPQQDSILPKYLKLEFIRFNDNQVPADTNEVEVEAIVTRICHQRKDVTCPVTQTSLGKVKIPINPTTSASPVVIVSRESFGNTNGTNLQSCVLHLSVTCHLQRSLPNGLCNGDIHEDGECEPSPKRRKNSQVEKNIEEEEEDVIVYGGELSVYNKREKCLLKSGDYDLILQELGSKFSSKKEVVWETSQAGKPVEVLEVFNNSPTLKFTMSWSSQSECGGINGLVPSEFLSNNQYSNHISFSGFDLESSMLKLKEESQSTPTKKVQVTYQFLYNENTRQQTDTRNNLNCPWCSLGCNNLYSLLKHLRLSHARFNFIYVPHQKGARIDVSLNERYDGSYSGSPQDLNSHIGYAFSRLGPVHRTCVTHIIVYRPKRGDNSLTEFYEPETENQCTRQFVQGHNRLYYRLDTCLPILPQEIDIDSEDETTPEWLRQKTVNMIDEFSDVNEGEKELMKMWNLHCMKYAFIADCQIPQACQSFVEEHGREIIAKKICKNFLMHMVNLFDFSLIRPDTVQRTLWQLYTLKEELDMTSNM